MRSLWKDILAAICLGIILPGFVWNLCVLRERPQSLLQAQAVQATRELAPGRTILLRDPEGVCSEVDLNTYLTRVLLAEIPAEFHWEALKAQSVASRTYVWKAYLYGGKHGDGSVCMDSACCQAYITEESYLSRGGTTEHIEKIHQAVQGTSGCVLAYEGKPIEATYFSSTDGSTESAVSVWGADYPYLQAVTSPEKSQIDVVSFTKAEFQNQLGRQLPENLSEWFGSDSYTEGGGVASMEICGQTYTGVELRSLLGLRSTDFSIQPDDPIIRITTRGYGHRVGMSQHGANAMAEQGSTWQEILQHYYPGTTLFPIS